MAVNEGVTTIEHVGFLTSNGEVRFDRDIAHRMRDGAVTAV